MRKTNILFLLNKQVYPYRLGGMEVFNYYLIRALKDRMDVRYSTCHPDVYNLRKHCTMVIR